MSILQALGVETPPKTPSARASTSASLLRPKQMRKCYQGGKSERGGNAAFISKRYGDAIDLYTKAVGEALLFLCNFGAIFLKPRSVEIRSTEPSYLTNRAASYMALGLVPTSLPKIVNKRLLSNPPHPPRKL